jgi:hypothetical protein
VWDNSNAWTVTVIGTSTTFLKDDLVNLYIDIPILEFAVAFSFFLKTVRIKTTK